MAILLIYAIQRCPFIICTSFKKVQQVKLTLHIVHNENSLIDICIHYFCCALLYIFIIQSIQYVLRDGHR